MRNFFQLISFLFLVALLSNACKNVEKSQFEGSWIGIAETEPFPELLFMYSDTSVMAKMYYREIDLQEVDSYAYEENTIKFSLAHDNFNGYFKGTLINDTIKGELHEGSSSAPCNFIRIKPEGPEQVSEFAGFYQLDETHVVRCEPFPLDFTLTPLLITDFKSGKKRAAFPVGNNTYLSGNRQLAPYPTDLKLTLSGGEEAVPEIALTDMNKTLQGKRLQDLEKLIPVSAKNKGAQLNASLTLPNSEGPHPLVVIVHGAGNQTRQNFTLADFSAVLPYYGMATLVYDKRGCGESEGDLQQADFNTLAEDVTKLIEEASKINEIDAQNIGLLGVDQASFLMPIIAQNNANIRFLAGISTPITSMQEQELQACAMRMRVDGFSEEQIEAALDYQNTMFDYLEGKTDSLTLQKKSDQLANATWKGYVTSFDKKEWIAWWRKNHHFEVKGPLEKVELPTYFIYGGQDPLLQAAEQIEVLEQTVPSQLLRTKIYPKANHFLYIAGNRGDFQLTEIKGYPEGLFYELNEWMATHLGLLKQ